MARRHQRRQRPQLARYPSIEGPSFEMIDQPCIAFHKYDGSNLQFQWTQKEGWCRFGTRKRTIDADNPLFGVAISIFMSKYADGILASVRKYKEYRNAQTLVAFCEFFGEHTFSGLHRDGESREMKLIDLQAADQGCVLAGDFRQHFAHLDIAEVVYEGPLTKQFMTDVYNGKYPVKEGVVAKGVTSKQRRKGKTEQETWMAKMKTKTWLDELQRRAGDSPDLARELEDNIKYQAVFIDADDSS